MSIEIRRLTLGRLATNCYIVVDTDTNEGVIIDPAAEGKKIMEAVGDVTITEILITHAHFDHVLAAGHVKKATGAPLRVHEDDIPQLEHSQQIAMMYGVRAPKPTTHDILLNEGDVITVGALSFEVIFTPGHSPGHVVLVMHNEKTIFSGDCIFQGSIGRTDFPGSDAPLLMDSIFNKILPIGDDYTLFPGHGEWTTIGQERQFNPFLQQ